ncbi:hypothetical protein LTR28_013395, partial [Elasticomyces elasticus]
MTIGSNANRPPSLPLLKPDVVVRIVPAGSLPPKAAAILSPRSQITSKTSEQSKQKKSLRVNLRKDANWDPPPLFQAYPQASKYGRVQASANAADIIARKYRSKKDNRSQGSSPETALRSVIQRWRGADLAGVNNEEERLSSSSAIQHALLMKVFVLCTSGYILQYSEQGPSDRLPEKMLRLGEGSAAFACDLIPGKHFALQISQAVDAQGFATRSSESLLSRLGLRSSSSRQTTSSFILVLGDAEEMNAWMVAVRREIEALGGPK